ncbi:MAG: 50S ribosomal protein L3 [Gammaproteobacteria bacterium RIFOXYB2_FULL_38_6]|nr:MAG: 50S ribosomal protein L3 [Gammaproteobacteria bacterium RIFOXYB2_FULL_38_6]
MAVGVIAQKCGMTRIFTEAGDTIPVTVLEVLSNRIAQIKTNNYRAIQVAAGHKKSSKVNKPMAGHFAKAGIEAASYLKEFRLNENEMSEAKVGDEIKADLFKEGQKVDVRAVTKGKGFAGVIKRHHFTMQDATHGNSLSHRAPGSTGQRQTPGRVMKGKKMAGHLGSVMRTIPNQQVVKVDAEKNLLMIKGVVPGAPGGMVIVTPSTRMKEAV